MEEFLELVKSEFPESSNLISAHTNFRQLDEWDSLIGMSILFLLEEKYNISIDDKTFKSFNTFSEIFEYIDLHKEL